MPNKICKYFANVKPHTKIKTKIDNVWKPNQLIDR
jgi:hypothetical protein